jgi:hypothetical protein
MTLYRRLAGDSGPAPVSDQAYRQRPEHGGHDPPLGPEPAGPGGEPARDPPGRQHDQTVDGYRDRDLDQPQEQALAGDMATPRVDESHSR